MQYPGFVGGTYQSQAVTADQERTVNFYFENMEAPSATSRSALYPTPGVTQINAGGLGGSGRAHFFENGREFAVIGNAFYEVFLGGTLVHRPVTAGTPIIDDGLPATISSNGDGGDQLFITSAMSGYIYNLTTNGLTEVFALHGRARMGAYVDGFFIALDSQSSTLLISKLLDGLTWATGTDFAQRTIAGDPWVSMKVLNRQIYLLGQETSEVWYNTAETFPFAPHPSGFLQVGCTAPFSATVLDQHLYWLGASKSGDGFVIRTSGYTPERVSTYAVQTAFDGFSSITDAQGDSYSDLGHPFYLLSFPTAKATWGLDSQTGLWAERGTWMSNENTYKAWRPRWHALAFQEHRMLDAETDAVYRMATGLPNDAGGGVIRRLRRAPALMAENQRVFYSSFELDLEPGLGATTGQGSNPQVMMRQSRDGGKTWGNERMAGAGKIGEYRKRVRWNRCGEGRRMVFEVSMTDPIPWRVTNAYLDLGQPAGVTQRQAAQR